MLGRKEAVQTFLPQTDTSVSINITQNTTENYIIQAYLGCAAVRKNIGFNQSDAQY